MHLSDSMSNASHHYEVPDGNAVESESRLQIEFMFKDINVHINNVHILHDVSGIVNSGEVLAVMGPSGRYLD